LIGDDGKAKITDFGVSTIIRDGDLLNNNQGTYHFMAPETLSAEKNQGYSGRAADLWSLGVTFFAFTFLAVPFNGDSV
jgi:[calcium/calmodulin-dependent protein kinase] kinase